MRRMTRDEKLSLMAGAFVGEGIVEVPGVARLGVDAMRVTDGPAGITAVPDDATQLPAPLALAATFDPTLAARYGEVLGSEAAFFGARLLFAPELNLARDPRGGRNFETLGEDPLLASRLAVPQVHAIQRHGVISAPKHFVANDQERFRFRLDARVDERTLRELYLAPFEAALSEGRAGAMMAAYPRVNGDFMTENAPLLEGVARREWRWPGFVLSDYLATHSTVPALRAGLDLELPAARWYGEPLSAALADGRVQPGAVDRAVTRILRAQAAAGLLDRPPSTRRDAQRNAGIARDVAAAGTVLLQNRRAALPLPARVRRLAVLGPAARHTPVGLGSAAVETDRAVDAVTALREALPDAEVTTAPGVALERPRTVPASALSGLRATAFANPRFAGPPAGSRRDRRIDADFGYDAPARGVPSRDPRRPAAAAYSIRWTGRLTARETGAHELGVVAAGGVRLFVDDRLVLDAGAPGDVDFHHPRPLSVRLALRAGRSVRVRVDYVSPFALPASVRLWWTEPSTARRRLQRAVGLARSADAAVVVVRDWAGEGSDRPLLRLTGGQEELIAAVARANPRTVVVLATGGPVDVEPWLPRVPAVLAQWYAGQEGGRALADVLLGRSDPSGRLPMSFPRDLSDAPTARPGRYPKDRARAVYGERLQMGYRWYDRRRDTLAFPFGYGLSYTRFVYRDLRASGRRVRVTVANAGPRTGTAVPQLYVRLPDQRTPLRLAAFAKLTLRPGAARTITLTVPERALQVWDADADAWRRPPGRAALTLRTDATRPLLRAMLAG